MFLKTQTRIFQLENNVGAQSSVHMKKKERGSPSQRGQLKGCLYEKNVDFFACANSDRALALTELNRLGEPMFFIWKKFSWLPRYVSIVKCAPPRRVTFLTEPTFCFFKTKTKKKATPHSSEDRCLNPFSSHSKETDSYLQVLNIESVDEIL